MNLYLCHNLLGDYYVLADHPTEAQAKLEKKLDEADYGFFGSRHVTEIRLIAKAVTDEFNGKSNFCGDAALIL